MNTWEARPILGLRLCLRLLKSDLILVLAFLLESGTMYTCDS
ncbi:hypothetical protein RIEGSTA812A_PEG_1266 [invertebrate metagenome]|uniref:Uncharacterized protein n=1 Tax=invertebrate metagenome TaxID=1711999 RepID=A0A484HAD5_9ZZZZ